LTATLLDAARHLAQASPRRAAQPHLKRAASTAYYAVFDALARECADLFVGTGGARHTTAWIQVYRALDHGFAKNACQHARDLGMSTGITAFANSFAMLQEERYRADYNPAARFSRAEVIALIDEAGAAIRSLHSAPKPDRRAFAALVLFRRR
jgi:hypothetical protein